MKVWVKRWMKKKNELYFEHWQQMLFLRKIEQKETWWKQFMLVSLQNNSTHEMPKSHFKVILHIS